eukprot:1503362-Rhodomonas_salina.1
MRRSVSPLAKATSTRSQSFPGFSSIILLWALLLFADEIACTSSGEIRYAMPTDAYTAKSNTRNCLFSPNCTRKAVSCT